MQNLAMMGNGLLRRFLRFFKKLTNINSNIPVRDLC